MAKNPRSSGLDKTYLSLRFGVTDKPLTETEDYKSIPPVELERRIRYILYGGYEGGKGFKRLAANLQEEDLNNIPDETAKLWKDLTSEACTVAGKGEKVWAIGFFDYDPKTILALMVKYAVLPKNPSEDDVGRFIAGRAALAHWIGFEYLADLETVPYAAAEWWKRYIAHPNKGDSNSTKYFNIITECGLLITARMLSRFFTEEEFLFMAMERAHICSCLDIEFSNGMGDIRYWELTSTGIETAERMGLFAIFDEFSNSGKADITPGAGPAADIQAPGAGTDTHEAKSKGLDIAREIGASSWGEIRLVIRPGTDDTGGLTFHCGNRYKALSWKQFGIHKAGSLRGILAELAVYGSIDWKTKLDSKYGKSVSDNGYDEFIPDDEEEEEDNNVNSKTHLEWKRKKEQVQGNARKKVTDLNKKFLKHFSGWENPFLNDDMVTSHQFKKIELKNEGGIPGIKLGPKKKSR